MTAADRRRAILEALSSDKFTTRANLAFEFGVSKRTIDHDLLLLSRKYPIYAIPGKGGGIHVMENFRLDGRYLTEEQMDVLVRLTKEVSESDRRVLRSILKKFCLMFSVTIFRPLTSARNYATIADRKRQIREVIFAGIFRNNRARKRIRTPIFHQGSYAHRLAQKTRFELVLPVKVLLP